MRVYPTFIKHMHFLNVRNANVNTYNFDVSKFKVSDREMNEALEVLFVSIA